MIFLYIFISFVFSPVPPDQRAALVDLYNSAGGVSWKAPTNWLKGDPCDNKWAYLYCDGDLIQGLNLNGAGVGGTLPESIGALVDLEAINIEWQTPGLTGPIPESFGNFRRISIITMVDNQLTGSLPESIGQLGELELLHLGGNNITGIPASVKNLKKCTSFAVEQNNINTPLPAEGPPLADPKTCTWLTDCNLAGNPDIPDPKPEWATKCCDVKV